MTFVCGAVCEIYHGGVRLLLSVCQQFIVVSLWLQFLHISIKHVVVIVASVFPLLVRGRRLSVPALVSPWLLVASCSVSGLCREWLLLN